jgi:C-terminal processing protease CtpA/Prc
MVRHAHVLAATLCLCTATLAAAQTRPASCTLTDQNLFVRSQLLNLYLWRIPLVVDPARFDSPQGYLEAVRRLPNDARFSYVTSAAASTAFYSDSQFIGFGFSSREEPGAIMILQVFPDSPAADAGLERGARVVDIDGRAVADLAASGDLAAAWGPSVDGVSVSVAFRTPDGGTRRATMVKRPVTIPTVSHTGVFTADSRRVGYLHFRNFVRPSVAALDEAFAGFAEAGIDELILDLRYNGGGLVDVAQHLGGLIGGSLTHGQVFATSVHNASNTSLDKTLRFNATAGLSLSRLTVIATQATASASELIINGLRPFMPVAVIGDRTYGKPVGQYLIEFCDKVLAPVSFRMVNANGDGDYFDGLAVTCTAPDDPTRPLGDPREASLAEALHYVRTGTCRTPDTLATGASHPHGNAAPSPATGWMSLVNAH